MKLIQSFLTNNPCYTAGRKITVKGLMLHSIGCPQPSAQVLINNWNRPSYKDACVHAFIDGNTGIVYQTLPWNHRGWHGGGSSNNTHIGVEMCESSYIRYTGGSSFTCSNLTAAQESARKTYNSAVELYAFLCKEYRLDPLKNIISHKEGHALGIATNHGDPEHYWTGLKLPYTMDTFRRDVKKCMDNGSFTTEDPQEVQFNSLGKVVNVSDYLNIRSGPGTSYNSIGKYVSGDKVNIVAKVGDWYKLDNNGYVNSNYIKLINWCDDIRDNLLNKGIITDLSQWSLPNYKDVVSKGLAVKLISNVYGNEPKENYDHWASNAVINLFNHNIITDKEQWKDLDTPISKALLLALICNATGGVSDLYKNRTPDHWARNCLDTLCDRGIVKSPQSWTDFEAQVQKDILMALIYASLEKIK